MLLGMSKALIFLGNESFKQPFNGLLTKQEHTPTNRLPFPQALTK